MSIPLKNTEHNSLRLVQPYVIAEVGVNHEGSMDTAYRLIDEAKEGGADAVKFQTYKAATLAAKDSPAYWDLNKEPCANQYELFKRHQGFWRDEYEKLKLRCDNVGIEFCSTPFDTESATFLDPLMPYFKVSSSDITNKPFIEFLCGFGKPIILSVGASTISEIDEAVSWVEKLGNKLAILHCVLNYPTMNENANLGVIPCLQYKFPSYTIGYSDHTLPSNMESSVQATLLGAKIIEKHFTHDKTLPGNDHYHAMDKADLRNFRNQMDNHIKLFGSGDLSDLSSQDSSRKNARRSLVLEKDISVGDVICRSHLTWKRPASGISPKYIEEVVGRKITSTLPADTILKWEHLGEKA